MTENQWRYFSLFKERFKNQCHHWSLLAQKLTLEKYQAMALHEDNSPLYEIENPVVYNEALDDITIDDDISLIVVGDNPGKEEQRSVNKRYLVGQSGKIAEGFFKRNPSLSIDFRKNVIILNKSPIHTSKTKQLAYLKKTVGSDFTLFFEETLVWMAKETSELQAVLDCDLWLVGYGELKKKGLFESYTKALAHNEKIRVFQHFSMNRFLIDLHSSSIPTRTLKQNLDSIGIQHRNEVLGW